MRKTFIYLFALLLFFQPFLVFAQPGVSARNSIKEEKEKFIGSIKTISADSVIVYPLARSVDLELNNIYTYLRSVAKLPADEKDKAIRSMVYFIKELSIGLEQRKLGIYDIPGTVQSYKGILM